jgi:hypothetical protein
MRIKVDVECHWGRSAWIGLWRGGAICIAWEREPVTAWLKPEAEKQNGEWLMWWGRLHVIFTPPGWKPFMLSLKEYDPA